MTQQQPSKNSNNLLVNSKSSMKHTKSLDHEEIESIIEKAISKIQGSKENDLCKFLPMASGGYMHHFTLRKMKLKHPKELLCLIDRFIIRAEKPNVVPPKQRAARGSKNNKDQITFTKAQIDRLFHMAKLTQDKEMLSILSSRKSFATCKRELIQSIQQGIIDTSLWSAYVESCQLRNEASHMKNTL